MKYKVGDKVKIKSLDWYNKNRNELGDVMISNKYGNFCFTSEDSKLCGKIVTIEDIDKSSHGYILAEDFRKYYFSDEMIERLAEEETQKEVSSWMSEGKLVASQPKYTKLSINTEFCNDKVELVVSPDYELKQEGDKWFAVKKKSKYPKTYEECINILGGVTIMDIITYYYGKQLKAWYKLLICRDAYWKIAGEEMGLEKPWEPEWNNCKKYIIKWDENNLTVLTAERIHAFLVFPTKEMANEFLNCFRDLIEQAGDLI